ncbi:MAG: four helix bundle protein [Candidatus Levybacteria bacterium]|nr:four helix bundle protein [Candidatus Levybacteria bacterium]
MGIKNSELDKIKKIQKFTDLVVWQEGHKLVLLIYKETEKFPLREKYGLTDQMRRAVVSITSNIAEGFSRYSSKDKNHFYLTARGSLTELQNQLLISKDVGNFTKEIFNKLAGQSVIVNKLLTGLLKATRLKSYEP